MENINKLLLRKRPNSERSYWIEQVSEMVGIPFKKILWKFNHLTGKEGTKIIKEMYLESKTKEGKWQAITFWTLLKKTKI